MDKAIKLAIEGGYRKGQAKFLQSLPEAFKSQIWLEPEFWKCLGKAEGWKIWSINAHGGRDDYEWLYHWHRFIDHIAEGKSVESFFEELIKKQK